MTVYLLMSDQKIISTVIRIFKTVKLFIYFKKRDSSNCIVEVIPLSVLTDIQEFYEVTLSDNQRCSEPIKGSPAPAAMNLWDFSSLQSPTGTSDTMPSISTSIEVGMTCV